MPPLRPRRSSVVPVSTRPVPAPEAQVLLLPLFVALMLAAVLAWPSRAQAQPTGAAQTEGTVTHTVQAGETLWSLAVRYYGSGHQWRDLARLNGLQEGGERVISVGQVLRVPVIGRTAAATRATTDTTPPATVPPTAVAVAAPADPAAVRAAAEASAKPDSGFAFGQRLTGRLMNEDRPVAKLGLVPPLELARARSASEVPTIFLGPSPILMDTMQGSISLDSRESFVQPAGPRPGEYEAAPYPISAETLRSGGQVVRRAQATGGSEARMLEQRMQLLDLVEITLPEGTEAVVGQQFVAVSTTSVGRRGPQVAVPTGLFTVEPARNGAVVARLSKLYGVVDAGQTILPLMPQAEKRPAAAGAPAVVSSVLWIAGDPLLPSLQTYVLLAAGSEEGVSVGDYFNLEGSRPEDRRVAVVRVVRVSPDGATGIVMRQEQAAINVGMNARRTPAPR